MIVSTINVNGIRAAVKQRSTENLGLLAWLKETAADVVCLQETRADDEQLADALGARVGRRLASRFGRPTPEGTQRCCGAEQASRSPACRSARRLTSSPPTAATSRSTPAELTVASVYFPTGEAETDRQLEKERFMAAVAARMAVLRRKRRDAVVCGDWNIGHTETDIKAWKANQKKAGFLPSERQWLTELLATGWVDVVRVLHPDVPGPYSWWSWRGKAFDNDAGWRIDYQLATPGLAARVVSARVERADAYALRWSDHAPVTVEYS